MSILAIGYGESKETKRVHRESRKEVNFVMPHN